MELKKIGVMSAGRIAALFGILLGLVYGLMVIFVPGFFDSLVASGFPLANRWVGGLVSLVIYAVYLFLAGIVCAALYNVFAKWVGGVELNLGDGKSVKKKR